MGFKADDSDKMTQAVTKFFAPEFRNRLDAIVSFSPLSPDVMLGIVEKNIRALEVKLHDKKVELEVSEEAKKWLAQKGYSKEFGARPLARVIQEHIADHLAPMVVFGELKNGGKVMVTVVDDKIVCSV
jgi:ATP-dependent Clp protease ATP-binding subunit ClpA